MMTWRMAEVTSSSKWAGGGDGESFAQGAHWLCQGAGTVINQGAPLRGAEPGEQGRECFGTKFEALAKRKAREGLER
jgi:hypothetical protein